jgi:hypothetical protein
VRPPSFLRLPDNLQQPDNFTGDFRRVIERASCGRATGHYPTSGPTMAKPAADPIPAGDFFSTIKIRADIMPTTNQGSSGNADVLERRSKGRTVINRGALMFFEGNEAVHPCCVRDVTNDGAGIRLNGLSVMPFEFGISFDSFRTMRNCRMIWREGDFLGVVFES